jgi:hypothetical protein
MKLFLSELLLSSNSRELNVPNKACEKRGYAQDINTLRSSSVYSTFPLAYFVILSPHLSFIFTHIYLTQTYFDHHSDTSLLALTSYFNLSFLKV